MGDNDPPAVKTASIKIALRVAIEQLIEGSCQTPRLDAELLLAHVVGQERSWLHTHPEALLSRQEVTTFIDFIARRQQGEPVAYLTGHKEFYGLDFLVTPAVLIPRPETELIVELLLANDQAHRLPPHIADIGTGSGCLAITLAKHLPQAVISAVDISPFALAVARQNAERHAVTDRITFWSGDLLAPLEQSFDIIVSNPPYVSESELAATAPEIRYHEPQTALLAGPDGLAVIRRLLPEAKIKLNTKGLLLVEIGANQGPLVAELAREIFVEARVSIEKDLAGRDRVLVVKT